eukprot:CAMPEP_0178653200 /NCGR_PEP_ID=MMETSP0698-20121128/23044_1 /TAXON_ID=265572 /ORGANISM="Extubocellulus spinifer, Strain CCMP396" /LENGTH=855 /DNA_ID=CAMNT_0020294933 /DNA_START=477 /DNA_END=3046 /DNA_ORIENTATION=-
MVKHRGHELRVPGDRFYDPTNAWGPKLNPKKKNGPRRKVKPYYLLKSEKAMKDRIDGSEDEKEKRKQNDAEAARIRKFRAKKKAAEASGDATPGTPGSKRQQEEITAGQIRVLEKKLRLATEFKGRKRLEREEKEKKLEESDKQVKAAEDALQQAKLSKMLAMEENAEIRDEVAASSRKEKEYGLEISLLEEERRKLKDLFYAVRNAEGDEYQRVASLSVSPQSPPASRRHRVPVIAAASDRRDDEQLHHPSPNHCSPFQHQHFASPGVGYEDYENNLDDESSEDGSLSNNGVSLGCSAIGASRGSNASDDSEQAQESSPGKGQASKVKKRKAGGGHGSRGIMFEFHAAIMSVVFSSPGNFCMYKSLNLAVLLKQKPGLRKAFDLTPEDVEDKSGRKWKAASRQWGRIRKKDDFVHEKYQGENYRDAYESVLELVQQEDKDAAKQQEDEDAANEHRTVSGLMQRVPNPPLLALPPQQPAKAAAADASKLTHDEIVSALLSPEVLAAICNKLGDMMEEHQKQEQEQEQQQQQPHVDGDADPEEAPEVPVVRSAVEFKVDGATGTTCAIRPPMLGSILGNTAIPAEAKSMLGSIHGIHSSRSRKEGSSVVVVALGCLDGSVALVSTGVRLHDVSSNESNGVTDDKDDSAGTTTTTAQGGRIYCRLGTGSAVVTSLAWCPSSSLRDTLAVGRKDGAVDLYSLDENGSGGGGGGASGGGPSYRRIHRILCHPKPVRGLTFTADSALLIVGDDEGTLTVHDVVRTSRPTSPIGMVGSVLNAHTSYILDIAPLSDGKRFVSSGADGVVQVWDVGMLNSGPVHTFADGRGTGMVWAVAASSDGRRLATAHDNGVLVIYSAEE